MLLFTRIFGECKHICICHSDPTNSQAILQKLQSRNIFATKIKRNHASKASSPPPLINDHTIDQTLSDLAPVTADEVRDTAEITRQAVSTGPGTYLACQARQSRPGSSHRYSVQRVVPATHVSTPLQERHCPTTVDEVHCGSQRSGVKLTNLQPRLLVKGC